MRHEATERLTMGQENRKVIEAQSSVPRYRANSFLLVQFDERNAVACRKHGDAVGTSRRGEPEHVCVVLNRSRQVAYL